MSFFTKRYFESMLANDFIVDSSKIKEIRTWLLGHKLHFQAIVRIWFKELVKSRNDKKLAFIYLAYDVILHSIKDCPELVTEFGMYMKKLFQHLVTVNFDEKLIGNIGVFIKIWRKRGIFDEEIQGAIEKIWKERSVNDIIVVKELRKEKGCVNELPPHLTCSVCSGLLKEPVQLPCCKTALCKLCAFAKLEQHTTCWFGFCPKSFVVRKDEVNLSPELALQVDLWKAQNKERFKENSPVMDLEAQKNVGQQINESTKIEYIEANFEIDEKYKKRSRESSCTDTRPKADPLDSKKLFSVASENMSKSINNNLFIVNDKANFDLAQRKKNEDFNRNGKDGIVPKKEIGIKDGENGHKESIIKHEERFHDDDLVIHEDYVIQEHGKGFKRNDGSSNKGNFVVQNSFNGQFGNEKCESQKSVRKFEGHSCDNHWLCDKNSKAGCLMQWINPSREEKEKCTASVKDSPMRKAMKRRIHCDEEGSKKKSQMCNQKVDDNCEASGIVRISDEASSKEKKLVNSMRTEWVKVCGDEIEEPVNIGTEHDGTLLFSSITSQFPGTTGLKYRNPTTNCFHSVRLHNNSFLSPKEGWTGIKFVCVRYNCMKLTKNLVVHGLAPTTREEDVKKYFEKFGEVLTVRVFRRVKCFAFVRFAQKAAELAVLSQTHMIDARWCFVAYSNSIEMDMCQNDDNRTVFVDGVTEALTLEDLKKYFENFGYVTDVRGFYQPRKNFAFVEFSDIHVAVSLRTTQHVIKGANVRVYEDAYEAALKSKQNEDAHEAVLKSKQNEDAHEAVLESKQNVDAHEAVLKSKQNENAHEAVLQSKQNEDAQEAVLESKQNEDAHEAVLKSKQYEDAHEAALKSKQNDDAHEALLESKQNEDAHEAALKSKQNEEAHEAALKSKQNEDALKAALKTKQCEVAHKTKQEDNHCRIPGGLSGNKNHQGSVYHILLPLPKKISVQDIRCHFEKFGEVLTVQLRKSLFGELWGNAFIKFAKTEVADKIIGHQLIGDQWCNTVRATEDNAWKDDEREIFVSQITEAITVQNLKNHFQTFGQVTDVRISKQRRNFAFVRFSDRNVVASLVGRGDHVIKGVTVKIEKAIKKR